MRDAVRKLYGAALVLVLLAGSSYYLGVRMTPAAGTHAECDICFAAGDGWKVLGGFLLVVAVALASAATMLLLRDRREGDRPASIIS